MNKLQFTPFTVVAPNDHYDVLAIKTARTYFTQGNGQVINSNSYISTAFEFFMKRELRIDCSLIEHECRVLQSCEKMVNMEKRH